MASQNAEDLISDPWFYHEKDPIKRLVARMEVVADSVNKISDKMGKLFRRLIKCAKYQDIEPTDYTQLLETVTTVKEKLDIKSEDYVQLSKTITMVKEQLEQLKEHLWCAQIRMDIPWGVEFQTPCTKTQQSKIKNCTFFYFFE